MTVANGIGDKANPAIHLANSKSESELINLNTYIIPYRLYLSSEFNLYFRKKEKYFMCQHFTKQKGGVFSI
jgi:hypothetical protein